MFDLSLYTHACMLFVLEEKRLSLVFFFSRRMAKRRTFASISKALDHQLRIHANLPLFINGRFMDAHSRKSFPTFNPATGEKLSDVQLADEDDVNCAVQAVSVLYSWIQAGTKLTELGTMITW